MKPGIFIYQAPPGLGRNIIMGAGSLGAGWSITKEPKTRKEFIEELNKTLENLAYPVNVVEDQTEANLEEIAAKNYDFIICTPGLQKRVTASDELPPIIYLESIEYHNALVNPAINKISEILNN